MYLLKDNCKAKDESLSSGLSTTDISGVGFVSVNFLCLHVT